MLKSFIFVILYRIEQGSESVPFESFRVSLVKISSGGGGVRGGGARGGGVGVSSSNMSSDFSVEDWSDKDMSSNL